MNEEEKARLQQWFEDDDPLGPAKGVINGLGISLVLWIVIALVLSAIYGWLW